MSLVGMGFDSICAFAPPTILLGHVHTAIFKVGNKKLLYNTWNSAQCYVPA